MQRHFVKKEFTVTDWASLEPYFKELQDRRITSVKELEQWLLDSSELGAVVSENMAWRYIKMTCDTKDEAIRDSFNDFVVNIEPHLSPVNNALNKKLVAQPQVNELNKDKYFVYIRGVKKASNCTEKKIFRCLPSCSRRNRNSAPFPARRASSTKAKK
ncbi:MAG: hypothetical protein ACXVPQ_00780 [Bacteroidia bacterium]